MIDLTKVSELKFDKIIDKIEDSNGLVIYEGWKNLIASGVPLTLLNSKGVDLVDYKIYGNSVQNGIPTPDTPIEVESIGDYDETTGKYKIPVKVSGKNLLIESLYRKMHSTNGINCEYEGNGIFHIFGEHTAGSSTSYFYLSNFPMPVPLIGNEYYTYSAKLIEGTTTHNIIPYLGTKSDTVTTKNWLAVSITPNTAIGETVMKTLKANYYLADANSISNMWFYVNCPANETFIVDCRIQVWLEKSSTSTNYEPYVEPITTNIYLNEPLRKVGDYADYIDFKEKKVVRNISKIRLTGSEFWAEYNSTNTYKRFLTRALDTIAKPYMYSAVKSNYFKGTKTTGDLNSIKINSGSAMTEFYLDPTEFESLDAFKTWLSTNNVEVEFISNTPTEENIELPNIPTIKGTTILSVDTTIQPSNLEVVYKGKEG